MTPKQEIGRGRDYPLPGANKCQLCPLKFLGSYNSRCCTRYDNPFGLVKVLHPEQLAILGDPPGLTEEGDSGVGAVGDHSFDREWMP